MQDQRDPVSILFDDPAVALLRRAVAAKGAWQGTRVADPSDRQRAMLLAIGINPNHRDIPSAVGGRAIKGRGVNAKTRWVRGFVRAVYYANEHERAGPRRALQIEVGRWKPAGVRVPSGYAVRLRVRAGGTAALHAVQGKPDEARIWLESGEHGGRWSDPGLRDWA